MKKARIMLAIIALFAIIASSLAFKAQNYGSVIFTGTSSTLCTDEVLNKTITATGKILVFASSEETIFCPGTFTTTRE